MITTLNVEEIISPMIQVHRSGENRSLQWRLRQLDALERMINENKDAFSNAVFQDLHKSKTEFILSEFLIVQQEIKKFKRELFKWMKPIQVPSPGSFAPCFSEIQSVPLSEPGCLVIAPFNYPFSLSLLPFIGSIGGGNPCVLKPSELCQNLSSLFAELIPKYFAQGVFQVIEGGVDETNELMKKNWGLCVFTGSERVGRIIQQKAALTLTPTLLELGGKSPTIISDDCPNNIDVICDRIVFGKLMNCGQTCISPDYVLCHESKFSLFCEEIVRAMERRLSKHPLQDSKLSRIVTEKHSQRHLTLLQEVEQTKGKVIFGGSKFCSPIEKYTAPTVIIEPSMDSRLMREEIFGPILPIFSFSDDEEAISTVNKMGGTPLALYIFTKSRQRYAKFTARCPSGSAMRNDTILHFVVPDLPIGGLGTSGIGRYRGKSSFDTFTHKKSSMYHPCHPAFEFWGLRYNINTGGTMERILLFLIEYVPLVPVMTKCKRILIGSIGILIIPLTMIILNMMDSADDQAYFSTELRSSKWFRTISTALGFAYIFLIIYQKISQRKFPSERLGLVHVISGAVIIYSGCFLHIQNELRLSAAANEDGLSNTYQDIVYYAMGIMACLHTATVLQIVPYVMGEKRITVPVYFGAGLINLHNGIILLLNPSLRNAFLLWGSMNTFVYHRVLVVGLMFSDLDWELLYTYAILAAASITYPLSLQAQYVYVLVLLPILYGPFHEKFCETFGFPLEDTAGGNVPSKKNIQYKAEKGDENCNKRVVYYDDDDTNKTKNNSTLFRQVEKNNDETMKEIKSIDLDSNKGIFDKSSEEKEIEV